MLENPPTSSPFHRHVNESGQAATAAAIVAAVLFG